MIDNLGAAQAPSQEVNGRLKRKKAMASILVRRDQFNITLQGIIHKPTNSYFAPHVGDPYSGSIHVGQLGNAVPVGERYDLDLVKKMMMQLWAEYVALNFDSSNSSEWKER